MTDQHDFYLQRDRRTAQCGAQTDALTLPVTISVGERAAATPGGQVATLALVNMVTRAHRRIDLRIPHAPLIVASPWQRGSLAETAAATALAIDPFNDIVTTGSGSGTTPPASLSVGIGTDANPGCTWYLGGNDHLALLARHPVPVASSPTTRWGSALAACLGAAALYWQAHGRRPQPARVSLWGLTEGADATTGPALVGPVDVGDVAVIGAGAVGAGLCYWLGLFGVTGDWTVVDGDIVELHNTNRSLAFSAADAGWPFRAPQPKAAVAATLIGATPYIGWYHDWMSRRPTRPDLVLALANDGGVRHAIGQRSEPALLHATTSRAFTAELHRHIPDRDDCIACRFPQLDGPQFECSTARAPSASPDNESADAALPFLSAASSLLLASALAQLPGSPLVAARHNHWRLHLELGDRIVQATRHRCRDRCQAVLPADLRQRVHAGRRWSHLDSGSLATASDPESSGAG